MKKYIFNFYIIIFFSTALTQSCKKSYLDTKPSDAVPAVNGITNLVDATNLINGIHRSLYMRYNAQGEGGQGAAMICVDAMGEDFVMSALGNNWYINTCRWVDHRNANGALPLFIYQFYYQIIANSNLILDNIDKISGPAADKQLLKAQALTYRAWSHFNLVQFFGKRYDAGTVPNSQLGIPLMTSFTIESKPRATVEEVYTQINKDLDDAITAFATAKARPNKSHLNVNVAKGVKARVALTQQNWTVAATMASEARTGFTLMSNAQYMEGFNNIGNPEWIWGSDQIEEQGIGFASFFAYVSPNFNSTNIRTNPKLINNVLHDQIAATDIRKQCWDPTGNTIPANLIVGLRRPYMTRKFLAASQGSSVGDLPNMRAGEMYLIEAEAKARLNDNAGAAQALFTLVKNRDASYVLSTNTGQNLINEILFHRRVELWGEGFRFFDLKRMNAPLNRNGFNHTSSVALIFNVAPGDNLWQMVFPQDEINANKLIVQNP
jgi:starch-binding outer membrane protein, SusD/RagB family